MKKLFAIGDIHGCNRTFQNLLNEKLRIKNCDEVYCIGDYIDRGPDSKGVIDFILTLQKQGYQIHTLRGNHEQMMMDSVIDEEYFDNWISNGGKATLKSFKIKSYNEMDWVYKDFFNDTKYFIESEKYIFVHAGLNFKNENIFADKEAMLWIRDFYVDKQKLGNRVVIHGHTPVPIDLIFEPQNSNVINIDGGCVYKNSKGYGNLFALDVMENKLVFEKNIEI